MSRKSKLYREEINVTKRFLLPENDNFDMDDFAEIEHQICHLKTFSNLAHRRYARMLYHRIRKVMLNTRNESKRFALRKLAGIIELKISSSL